MRPGSTARRCFPYPFVKSQVDEVKGSSPGAPHPGRGSQPHTLVGVLTNSFPRRRTRHVFDHSRATRDLRRHPQAIPGPPAGHPQVVRGPHDSSRNFPPNFPANFPATSQQASQMGSCMGSLLGSLPPGSPKQRRPGRASQARTRASAQANLGRPYRREVPTGQGPPGRPYRRAAPTRQVPPSAPYQATPAGQAPPPGRSYQATIAPPDT